MPTQISKAQSSSSNQNKLEHQNGIATRYDDDEDAPIVIIAPSSGGQSRPDSVNMRYDDDEDAPVVSIAPTHGSQESSKQNETNSAGQNEPSSVSSSRPDSTYDFSKDAPVVRFSRLSEEISSSEKTGSSKQLLPPSSGSIKLSRSIYLFSHKHKSNIL